MTTKPEKTRPPYCPECGRRLRLYKRPPRLICESCGQIPRDKALRPDPAEPTLEGDEKIIKQKGRKYLK